MKKLVVFCALALAIGCSKDKYETKPTVKITEGDNVIVPFKSGYRAVLEFTDKEGDVTDSVIVVRNRLNRRGVVFAPAYPLPIPTYPGATKGELQLDLDFDNQLTFGIPAINVIGSSTNKETDTLLIKFVVRDKKGNKSDTAVARVFVRRSA